MLNPAIASLCVAVLLGMWLSSQHLLEGNPPRFIGRVGAVHGAAGALCVGLLYLALRAKPAGAGHGAGGFGWTAFWMLAATLLGGLAILSHYLRGRLPPTVLVAVHACVGIGGAVMLAAYYSSSASFGR
jgi:hypothetical protein